MYAPSKIVHGLEIVCSSSILVLVLHVSCYGRTFFGASPTVTGLLLVAFSNLLINIFILATVTASTKIYETPLIFMHTSLFFILQVALGMTTILESKDFVSEEQKEFGVAGAISIFAALASIIGCYPCSSMCKYVKYLPVKTGLNE
ncbi:hypothetical protein JTE90_025436 [Oedothorax gibbosus]|uniref:Uncharacterized protein n=1 Tax=Oedothorax gibbosus TaxID=931172 RepID=A0AAV6U9V0_9ARAC|nr:hypothetical protein JTE90_025436 [Oedothorax gibbosus]